MALVERLELQQLVNPAGSIVVAQVEREVPFPIRRVYFLHGVPAHERRGGHAHKQLTQVAVCASGSCRFVLDNGVEREEVVLARPNEAILIRPGMWREMSEFSPDCVLLVLASEQYDESDYIRDYEAFKAFVAKR